MAHFQAIKPIHLPGEEKLPLIILVNTRDSVFNNFKINPSPCLPVLRMKNIDVKQRAENSVVALPVIVAFRQNGVGPDLAGIAVNLLCGAFPENQSFRFIRLHKISVGLRFRGSESETAKNRERDSNYRKHSLCLHLSLLSFMKFSKDTNWDCNISVPTDLIVPNLTGICQDY